MMTAHRAPLSALLASLIACTFIACGDSESNAPFDPTDLPEGTATEAWGIGDLWYDYTFDGHTVAPRNISWVIIKPEQQAYFVRVARYYGDDGASGKPTMFIHAWDAETETFGEPAQWSAPSRITAGNLCLNLHNAETVPCDGDYDILWRTDKRPVPEVGFAPSNPGIFVERRDGTTVYQYQQKTPPETLPTREQSISSKECAVEQSIFQDENAAPPATEEDEGQRNPDCELLPWRVESAFDHDATPLINLDKLPSTHSVFHLTANLRIAQWSAHVNTESNTLDIEARCVRAVVDNACTDALDMQAQSLSIDLESADQWSFVSLCALELAELVPIRGLVACRNDGKDDDTCIQTCAAMKKEDKEKCVPDFVPPLCDELPCVTHQQEDLRAGAWPDNRTFDLAVQTTDDNVRVWVSPSQPITVKEETLSKDTTAPRALWSIPGPEVCK